MIHTFNQGAVPKRLAEPISKWLATQGIQPRLVRKMILDDETLEVSMLFTNDHWHSFTLEARPPWLGLLVGVLLCGHPVDDAEPGSEPPCIACQRHRNPVAASPI